MVPRIMAWHTATQSEHGTSAWLPDERGTGHPHSRRAHSTQHMQGIRNDGEHLVAWIVAMK